MASPPRWEIVLPVDRPDANPEWYRIQFAEGEYLYVFGSLKAGRLAVDCVNSALAHYQEEKGG